MPGLNYSPPVKVDEGRFPNYKAIEKFGYNAAVSNTVFEDVWVQGGDLTWPATARTLTIQSAGNDNGAGSTGAQKIMIEGLDANWNELSEEIETDAAVDPTTTNAFLRVNRAYVTDVGTLGTNEGAITLTTTTDLDIQAAIGAGLGQTEKSHLSIPAGFNAIIYEWTVNNGKADDHDTYIQTREFGKSWRIRKRALTYESEYKDECIIRLPEKSDIRIQSKGGGVDRPLDTSYKVVLYRNS